MVNFSRIEGDNLALRLVTTEDAVYIKNLRNNPDYNKYLSSATETLEGQIKWINEYKNRECLGKEYYYLIERRSDRIPCGLVRIYDIHKDRFTWGSWILDYNKPSKAAFESAILSFNVGFSLPGMRHALISVRRANSRAEAFYRRFGMIAAGASSEDIFFTYSREAFLRDHGPYIASLAGNHP